MVTGRAPFRGSSEYVVMQGHLKEKPISPIKFNNNISKSLNKIILKSISKDPEKRYSSVFELIQSLKSVNNKDSILSNVSFYLNDKIENVYNFGPRNLIVLFVGFVLSIALINFAIAKISNNKSDKNILSTNDNPEIIQHEDIKVDDNIKSSNDDNMLFNNKYVIFEPEDDLSRLNKNNSDQKQADTEFDNLKVVKYKNAEFLNGDNKKYTKPQNKNIPEYKKVYYKPKKNKIAENRTKKKWRIRK